MRERKYDLEIEEPPDTSRRPEPTTEFAKAREFVEEVRAEIRGYHETISGGLRQIDSTIAGKLQKCFDEIQRLSHSIEAFSVRTTQVETSLLTQDRRILELERRVERLEEDARRSSQRDSGS